MKRLTEEREQRLREAVGEEVASQLLALDASLKLRVAQFMADAASDDQGMHFTVALVGTGDR